MRHILMVFHIAATIYTSFFFYWRSCEAHRMCLASEMKTHYRSNKAELAVSKDKKRNAAVVRQRSSLGLRGPKASGND